MVILNAGEKTSESLIKSILFIFSAMTDVDSVQAVFEKALEIHFQKEKKLKSVDVADDDKGKKIFCTVL